MQHAQRLVVHFLPLVQIYEVSEFLKTVSPQHIGIRRRQSLTFCAFNKPSTSSTSHQFSIRHTLPTNTGLATR